MAIFDSGRRLSGGDRPGFHPGLLKPGVGLSRASHMTPRKTCLDPVQWGLSRRFRGVCVFLTENEQAGTILLLSKFILFFVN